jgi:serpin B
MKRLDTFVIESAANVRIAVDRTLKSGRYILCGILLVTLALGWGCRESHPAYDASPDVKFVVKGNNAFALELYHRLDEREGNLIFSPLSIYTALGMTYAGARGPTESEMAKALQFSLPQRELHPAFHEVLDRFDNIHQWDGIDLSVANSLWPREGFRLTDTFLGVIHTNYDAGSHPLNFADAAAAARQINEWVERKTNGKISDVIGAGQITSDTRLLLCSAIYFDGKWQTQFDPKNTALAKFEISPYKSESVPTMYQLSPFRMTMVDSGDITIQLLDLPYTGEDLSMVLLLPLDDTLSVLEAKLTLVNLDAWLEKLDQTEPQKTEVFLPRFVFHHKFDLVSELKSIGISSAFNMDADLSGMDGTTNLFIADVVHMAVIDCNEAGTQASAATWVKTNRKSLPPSFCANHPFIFLIRDNSMGCILFMGRVVNPLEH